MDNPNRRPLPQTIFEGNEVFEGVFDIMIINYQMGLCPVCALPAKDEEFTDELSRKESKITGLCQKCQNELYATCER